jgi:hypothetical protein
MALIFHVIGEGQFGTRKHAHRHFRRAFRCKPTSAGSGKCRRNQRLSNLGGTACYSADLAGFLSSAVNLSLRRTRFIVSISKENHGEARGVLRITTSLKAKWSWTEYRAVAALRLRSGGQNRIIDGAARVLSAPTTTDAFRTKRRESLTQPYRGAAQERFPGLSVWRPAGESATTMTSPTNFHGG